MAGGVGDTSSVPEHGPIQAQYWPQTHVTQLGPINRLEPVNWMDSLGLAAREAGKQLMTSMANPAVREAARAEAMRAQAEQKLAQYYRDNPMMLRRYGSMGSGGLTTLAKAQSGVLGYVGDTDIMPTQTNDAPAAPSQTGGDGSAEAEKTTKALKPGPRPGTEETPADGDQSDQNKDTSKPFGSTTNFGGVSNVPAAPQTMDDLDSRIRVAVADVMNNPTAYLNPGGAAQYPSQPWYGSQGGQVPQRLADGGQVQQAPQQDQDNQNFPPSPSVSPALQQAAGGDPQKELALLRQWQGTQQANLHPVIPASAVKAALKEGVHTGVTDVVYNQGAGPGAQPSYTVYTKNPQGQGTTAQTLPLTQVAKFFPHLASGSNMSLAMSGADMQQGTPPGMGTPPAPVAPTGGAGAAPAATAGFNAGAPSAPGALTGGIQGAGQNPNDVVNQQIHQMVADRILHPENLLVDNTPAGNPNNATTNTSNVVKTNPSNFLDSWRSKDSTTDPNPPPIMNPQGIADVQRQNAAHQKEGWDKAQDANDGSGVNKIAAVQYDGAGGQHFWFHDTRSNISSVPFLVYSDTGYSQIRMPLDGQGHTMEVMLPDWQIKENLSKMGINPEGWSHNQMVAAVQQEIYNNTHGDFPLATRNKLETELNQTLQSQRGIDAITELNKHNQPGDPAGSGWSIIQRARAYIDQNSNLMAGWPQAQQWVTAIQHALGNAPAPAALVALQDAMTQLTDESRLGPEEKEGLPPLSFDNYLLPRLIQYNHTMAARLSRQISSSLNNNEKIDASYLKVGRGLRENGRVPDTGLSMEALDKITRSKPGTAMPSPTASPTPEPVLQAQPNATPLDTRNMTQEEMNKALRKQPLGSKFIDGQGLKILRKYP